MVQQIYVYFFVVGKVAIELVRLLEKIWLSIPYGYRNKNVVNEKWVVQK